MILTKQYLHHLFLLDTNNDINSTSSTSNGTSKASAGYHGQWTSDGGIWAWKVLGQADRCTKQAQATKKASLGIKANEKKKAQKQSKEGQKQDKRQNIEEKITAKYFSSDLSALCDALKKRLLAWDGRRQFKTALLIGDSTLHGAITKRSCLLECEIFASNPTSGWQASSQVFTEKEIQNGPVLGYDYSDRFPGNLWQSTYLLGHRSTHCKMSALAILHYPSDSPTSGFGNWAHHALVELSITTRISGSRILMHHLGEPGRKFHTAEQRVRSPR